MNTPISDLQKGRLEKIVIENNTYDRYYEVKHSKEDETLVARNHNDILALEVAKKAGEKVSEDNRKVLEALESKNSKALDALRNEQQKEYDALRDTQRKEEGVLDAKENQLKNKLEKAGLTEEYGYGQRYNSNEKIWAPDINRFKDAYVAWMRDLRAQIITATSAEEAKKLVDEFLLK